MQPCKFSSLASIKTYTPRVSAEDYALKGLDYKERVNNVKPFLLDLFSQFNMPAIVRVHNFGSVSEIEVRFNHLQVDSSFMREYLDSALFDYANASDLLIELSDKPQHAGYAIFNIREA